MDFSFISGSFSTTFECRSMSSLKRRISFRFSGFKPGQSLFGEYVVPSFSLESIDFES